MHGEDRSKLDAVIRAKRKRFCIVACKVDQLLCDLENEVMRPVGHETLTGLSDCRSIQRLFSHPPRHGRHGFNPGDTTHGNDLTRCRVLYNGIGSLFVDVQLDESRCVAKEDQPRSSNTVALKVLPSPSSLTAGCSEGLPPLH